MWPPVLQRIMMDSKPILPPKNFQKWQSGNSFSLCLFNLNLFGWTSQVGKKLQAWNLQINKITISALYTEKGWREMPNLLAEPWVGPLFALKCFPCEHFRSKCASSNLHLKGLYAELNTGRGTEASHSASPAGGKFQHRSEFKWNSHFHRNNKKKLGRERNVIYTDQNWTRSYLNRNRQLKKIRLVRKTTRL